MKKKPDVRSPRDFMPTPVVPREPLFDFPKETMKERAYRRRFYEGEFASNSQIKNRGNGSSPNNAALARARYDAKPNKRVANPNPMPKRPKRSK